MVRYIKRRDPTRPSFWYLSYCHPHPPLAPLQCYMDMYRNVDIEMPYHGEWSKDFDNLPLPLKSRQMQDSLYNEDLIRSARQAFYALCTHIDHQLRLVIGTLREEGLLNDTIILFTSDHGDMLGNHKMWAKRLYYEDSTNVPMILVGKAGDDRVGHNKVDNRLVGWQDVMPTLLHLAGVDMPDTVEGIPMVGDNKREWLYGEVGEGGTATRMIHEGRYKLIYYGTGNYRQLFDLEEDPRELNDLSDSPRHADILDRLTELLIRELYGNDLKWIEDGKLVGLPDGEYRPSANRNLSGQRGIHWPQSPSTGR